MWFFFLSLVDLNDILKWNLFIFTGIYWYDDDDINEKHYHLPSHSRSSFSIYTIQKKQHMKTMWVWRCVSDCVSYTKIFILYPLHFFSFSSWLIVGCFIRKKERISLLADADNFINSLCEDFIFHFNLIIHEHADIWISKDVLRYWM
jgi:hypothetical protein